MRTVDAAQREGLLLFLILPLPVNASVRQDEKGYLTAPNVAPVPDTAVLSLFNKLGVILSDGSTSATPGGTSSAARHARSKSAQKGDTALLRSWDGENYLLGAGHAEDLEAPVFADLRDALLR